MSPPVERKAADTPERPDDEAGDPQSVAVDDSGESDTRVKPGPVALIGKRVPPGPQKRTMPKVTDGPEKAEERDGPGWRTSRRTSRTGKQARRAAKAERVRTQVSEKLSAGGNTVLRVARVSLATLLAVVVAGATLFGAALGINAFARWNARRLAEAQGADAREDRSRENIVVIGVKDEQAIGFVAMKAERSEKRVLGIAIPDGAFMEVPGQGFERVGDSYSAGPKVSRDAVANFLTVPFDRYLVVDGETYQGLVTRQRVGPLVSESTETNMTKAQRSELDSFLKSVKSKDVWIVPLPVKPVAVADERYYEPQREEIADIVVQWWGVRIDEQQQAIRLIVYNGVGTPGVAGKAAQQLIRKGFRVVDSKNAENFDYKKTQILLYHGTEADATAVRETLGGVGEIIVQSTAQDFADMIIVIGSDYVPPAGS